MWQQLLGILQLLYCASFLGLQALIWDYKCSPDTAGASPRAALVFLKLQLVLWNFNFFPETALASLAAAIAYLEWVKLASLLTPRL